MKKSKKRKLFNKGVRSVVDVRGPKVQKPSSLEDNIHVSWNNVGKFWSRGFEKVSEGQESKPSRDFRKLSTF